MHVRHAVASLMFVAGTSVCHAQDGNKPAAQQFRAWMAVFNGGDRDSLVAFLKQDFPSRAEAAGREVALRDMTGGFDLRRIQESTPTEVVALVQERLSDQFAQVTMDVEPAVTHHITNLKLMAVPRPPGFALPHMSATELTTALRRKLDQDVAADGFAGAVLVAAAGTPVFEQAYGLADREHKTPNTLDTRFRMGSMNKMFTATAIMQLVQAGKVGLSDPLGKYLPDYPNKDVATKVTIAAAVDAHRRHGRHSSAPSSTPAGSNCGRCRTTSRSTATVPPSSSPGASGSTATTGSFCSAE